MSENAIEAQGVTLGVGDGASPEGFTLVPEIKDFSGPGGSSAIIDATDLDSLAKEKKVGLIDEGQLSFNINYIPDNAVHASLRTDRANRALRNFELTFTDTGATVWSFAAYVIGFATSGAVDSIVEAAVTLEISGVITEA